LLLFLLHYWTGLYVVYMLRGNVLFARPPTGAARTIEDDKACSSYFAYKLQPRKLCWYTEHRTKRSQCIKVIERGRLLSKFGLDNRWASQKLRYNWDAELSEIWSRNIF